MSVSVPRQPWPLGVPGTQDRAGLRARVSSQYSGRQAQVVTGARGVVFHEMVLQPSVQGSHCRLGGWGQTCKLTLRPGIPKSPPTPGPLCSPVSLAQPLLRSACEPHSMISCSVALAMVG